MAARIGVSIVVLGLIACALLEFRHARLQAAHELAALHERIRELDEEVLRIRAELAEAGGARAAAASSINDGQPILADASASREPERIAPGGDGRVAPEGREDADDDTRR